MWKLPELGTSFRVAMAMGTTGFCGWFTLQLASGSPGENVREFVKAFLRGLALVAVLPFLLSYWCRAALMGPDRALEGSSQMLSLFPGLSGQYLRRAFLMQVLAQCHKSVVVEFGTLFSQAGARLEENVYIGPRCHLGLAHVEKDTLIGPAVHIPSGAQTHGTEDQTKPIREQQHQRSVVRIGAGSWIGSAAVIMADVGKNTVVGAGAVVTKALPDNVVAAGVPAKVIRQR
jgi:acetyltransferase-like isoleucine patch superfamily enzyme